MSAPSTETKVSVEQQPAANSAPVVEEKNSNPVSELESAVIRAEERESVSSNPMDEIDTEEEEGDNESPSATVVPSNTPVTGDSGQGSPIMQSSSESLSDDAQQSEKSEERDVGVAAGAGTEVKAPKTLGKETMGVSSSSKDQGHTRQNGSVEEVKAKPGKEGRKEDKKKSKKKEDKSVEYILRALNSLQSPEEKLAALCKKYADLHEEHRVLQTSMKTQQRTMTVVMREKDQLQSEHTKAIMAKSKLESLCRELQKHNKLIKEESIKRAKEDDEKRKEISAQFNNTIGEIQTQMTDNSERNSKLRQENENLAAQLKGIIQQMEIRDQQVEKMQAKHELEKKLAEAKVAHAQALVKEGEERTKRERELMAVKLVESGKKTTMLEAQVAMFKERYDEFEQLHSRSNDTFQKYKTEMDKMTKRIKKLEKDGLQWKAKWEGSNKALIEQVEARSKSEKETLVYAQKTKKLESLCRALQAELHGKKVVTTDTTGGEEEKTNTTQNEETPATSAVPPNSPESSNVCTPDSGDGCQASVPDESNLGSKTKDSARAEENTTTAAATPSSESTSSSSPASQTTATEEASKISPKDEPLIPPTDPNGVSHGAGGENGAAGSSLPSPSNPVSAAQEAAAV